MPDLTETGKKIRNRAVDRCFEENGVSIMFQHKRALKGEILMNDFFRFVDQLVAKYMDVVCEEVRKQINSVPDAGVEMPKPKEVHP